MTLTGQVDQKNWKVKQTDYGPIAAVSYRFVCSDVTPAARRPPKYAHPRSKMRGVLDATHSESARSHVRDDDDVEALVIAAKETKLDRAWREHLEARAATNSQTIIRRNIGQITALR